MRKKKKNWILYLTIIAAIICIIAIQPANKSNLKSPDHHFLMDEFPSEEPAFTEVVENDSMKGVWISYLEFESILMGKSESSFQAAVDDMFETCIKQGINTVFVQVRSHGDAIYPSKYYPWSVYASGEMGKSLEFDPVAILVDKAKEYNLSIHAWVNPYRLSTDDRLQQVSSEYLIADWYEKGDKMKKQDGYYYLDPSDKEVRNLICNGVKELLENYDFDGVQIDDYFYVISPDVFGNTEKEARSSTSALVKQLYQTIQKVDDDLIFGVSPAGNFHDEPASDESQYTDLLAWCEKGWLDYLAPQIYWDFDDDAAPFEPVLTKWETALQDSDVTLYIGLGAYKLDNDVIEKQITRTGESEVAKGYILFRYDDIA